MKLAMILAAIGLFLILASQAVADDLAIVNLKNRSQTEIVKAVVPAAFSRDGNRFLVSLSGRQAGALTQFGINFEIVMKDVAPDEAHLVFQTDSRRGVGVDVPQLGESVSLGADLHLVRMSSSVAASLTRNTELTAVPLSKRTIPIRYEDPVVTYTLSQITDFPTDSLCDLVSQDSLYDMNLRLENFQTRYIFTDSILAARDWMVQKFLDWGYTDITTPEFIYDGYYGTVTCYNVKVVKPGYAEPDEVIVIGGHYDAITYGQPTDPMDYAPGADDDGSGTAMTLEMARILKDVPLRKTVIFMPFSAEEVGLVGSWDAAGDFYAAGTDIEAMFNYDMVGYNGNGLWMLEFACGANQAYRDLNMASCLRVNPRLTPVTASVGAGSDHWPFYQYGYAITDQIEEDFNYDGWHTDIDWCSRMDWEYMYEVARMTIASLAIVGNSARPTQIDRIVDQGDGHALEISWTQCDPTYDYHVLYGASSGVYSDTVDVPSGECSYLLDGLSEGQWYYFTVVATVADAYPSVAATEVSETPLVVPRAPAAVVADMGMAVIQLDWNDAPEADFDHYRLYRGIADLPFSLYKDNLSSSDYVDSGVVGQVQYTYLVTSVDADGYESDYSAAVSTYAATFDGGILLVDETRQGGGLPTQPAQEAFFASLFEPTRYDLVQRENQGDVVSRSLAGQYSSIFWIDDDFSPKLIGASEDSLGWYLGLGGNFLLAGLTTVQNWVSSPPVQEGEVLYDHFRVADYTINNNSDFAGAVGADGWPDVHSDTTSVLGYMPFIPVLTPAPGGQVIYTFDSHADDPAFEGEPCAVLYDGPNGIRIVLAFPLYFLTDESAIALVNHAKTLFGESTQSVTEGDIDGNGKVDISDLVYLVDYVFLSGPVPPSMNAADVDASCRVDVADVVYLVDYIFLSGAAPQAGCVE